MEEYIIILNSETGEVLYHQLTTQDNEILSNEHMLYTSDGVANLFTRFNLNPDNCLWIFTNNKPELVEI